MKTGYSRQKLSILIDTLLDWNGCKALSKKDFDWILAKKGLKKMPRNTWTEYGKVLKDCFGNRFEIEIVNKSYAYKLRRPHL